MWRRGPGRSLRARAGAGLTSPLQFELGLRAAEDAVAQRIAGILCGDKGSAPWPLGDAGCRLLRVVSWHKGSRNPITIDELLRALAAQGVEMSERDVKATIKSLVEDYALPIGASRQKPYGYFVAVTADDIELAVRPLVNEVRSLARRIRALAGAHRFAELMGQLQLEFGGNA